MKSGNWPLEPKLVIGWFKKFSGRSTNRTITMQTELQWPVTTFRVPIFLQDWPPLVLIENWFYRAALWSLDSLLRWARWAAGTALPSPRGRGRRRGSGWWFSQVPNIVLKIVLRIVMEPFYYCRDNPDSVNIFFCRENCPESCPEIFSFTICINQLDSPD